VANPYHVRLAISQYGDLFRAELFTEDLGDTDGELLPADWRASFERWMEFLQGGGALAADTEEEIGAQLFDWLLGGITNRAKWTEVLDRLQREPSRPLRLLIDSSTPTGPAGQAAEADGIHNLPYGLLFDRQRGSFVFRPQPGRTPFQYVRIVRRCTPRLLHLERARWPLRILVAAAEPEGLVFDGAQQLGRLLRGLAALEGYAVSVCTPGGVRPLAEVLKRDAAPGAADGAGLPLRTTREQLKAALAAGWYDLLHLMAHGRGSGLLLCQADGAAAELRGLELGEWCNPPCTCTAPCTGRCRENPRTQLAFLQVCKAARTGGRGAFGGLAQRLINPAGGDLAAVVASPYVLEANHSTEAALAFYEHLAREEQPDQALRRDLAMASAGWAFLDLWVRPNSLGDTGSRGAYQFVSPYRGLASFKERDADVFFCREAEVAELERMLRDECVVTVVGDSGSGKSSLLQAGLIHRVRTEGLAGRSGWHIVSVKPGAEPARNLMAGLLLGEGGDAAALPTPKEWQEALTALLQASCSEQNPLLLVIDQFEEMFTLCKNEAERGAVGRALAGFAQQAGGNARIVLGMRSDYLGSAATLPELGARTRRPWVLGPPGEAEVRAIVACPAEAYGYRFEGPAAGGDTSRQRGLLGRILSDPLLGAKDSQAEGGSPAARTPLPLLEFALERLWLRAVNRGSQEFSHDDYDLMGGLGGAIAQHADDVYQALPLKFKGRHPDPQRLAEFIFTSVVSTGKTRRPRVREELEEESGDPAVTRDLIDHLVGERLLTIRSDSNDLSRSQVDIAHEVLIVRWDKLRDWLNNDTQDRQLREDFQRDAESYAKHGQRLPPPATQVDYLSWLDRKGPTLTLTQKTLVQAMRRQVRLRGRIRAAVVGGSLVVTGLMAFLTIWALGERSKADTEKSKAETQKQRAEGALRRIEETMATDLVRSVGRRFIALERGEVDALLTLASLKKDQERVRVLFVEKLVADPAKARRLIRRAEMVLHAAVGLVSTRRQRTLDRLVKTLRKAKDEEIRLACAMGIAALHPEDPAIVAACFTPIVSRFKVETDTIAQAKMKNALQWLYTRPGARPAAGLILRAMRTEKSSFALYALAKGLKAVAARLTAEQARQGVSPILKALQEKTINSDARGALGEGLKAVAARLTAEQARQAVGQILKGMRSTTNLFLKGMRSTTNLYVLGALGEGLMAVAAKLAVGQASKLAAEAAGLILKARQKSPNYALRALGGGLKAVAEMLPTEQTIVCTLYLIESLDRDSMVLANILDFLYARLSVTGLIRVLKSPFCVGKTRQAVLRQLEKHPKINRRFTTLWDMVDWIDASRPDLKDELRIPPVRPQGLAP
jgi:hypothetical protein